ncbi:MAG: ABC transporter substrate-binding protein [Dehalococcoidia bacterium]|nr:ABC transporter substrate-binding protein [Dehalococcoidia bacterium]
MRSSKLKVLLFLTIVVSLVAAACGGGDDEAAPAATTAPVATARPTATTAPPPTATAIPVPIGQLRFAVGTFRTEEMLLGRSVRILLDPMYDYIVGASPDGKLDGVSGLATSWQMSPDGKTWTWKFRDTARWHDGTPVTVQDVIFTFGWFARPEAIASDRGPLQQKIASLTSPDAATMVMTLNTRDIFMGINFMSPLSNGDIGFVLPKTYLEARGETGFNRAPMASGPYKFKQQLPGSTIAYEAMDKHWYVGVPKYKEFTLLQVPEESTRLALLRTGDIEMTEVSRAGAKTAETAGFVVREKKDGLTLHVRLHDQEVAGNPLGILKVRQALDLSIDRQALVDTFLAGRATPAVQYVPSPLDLAFEKYPVTKADPERAKQLLAEAGQSGLKLNVVIHEIGGVPEGQEMMEAISVAWEKIGIKVNRIPLAYSAVIDKWVKRTFEVPTVTGIPILNNRVVNNAPGIGLTAGYQFGTAVDNELVALGTQVGQAASIEDYIRLTRDFARKYYDRAYMPTIAYVGNLYALKKGIGDNWDLGKGQNSVRLNELTKR